ncbi:homeobox protein cut isoform X3 [Aethina tumida]|uniref:homeobox protein cut isoform X3 n=1 Tax=Aethina tumida TaxID=116153 RepID=UPI0021493BEE|nr:homeobox protein cut isoform X3 [Aethina tumida]
MQPTATATVPPGGGDMETIQSMDWLFKKERIYLLAQFWQQRATLAEKEVATLKEQLSNQQPSCESKEGSNMDSQNFESELANKDKEITQLTEENQRLKACLSKLQETSIAQITKLEEENEQHKHRIASLEIRLDQQKDYDDLKRELSLRRSDSDRSTELEKKETKNENEGVVERTCSTPGQLIPPSFQNVEKFGSMLGEEIVSHWRRHLDARTNEKTSLTDCPKSETPIAADSTEKSAASTPQPGDGDNQPDQLVNGNPKTPEDNNNHHVSNNNIPITPTMCVGNFLRNEDLKSPYRFEDHRPFRFAEELGMAPGSMVSRLGESLIPKGDPMEAKLQEMLRYNMDKYASQNLDTLNIARRVRELLSIHNIGQRLFAKYILGLSQGTVSELLSKPKPWDKLTEKGRDSYRKMHAWACDDNAIMLLKSLIPKKDNFSTGKETGMPAFGQTDLSEERIAHILNEASQFQQMKTEDSHSNEDSKSPHGCSSPFSKDSSMNKRLKKYENDDISQEKVLRIYQEELAKLMGRRMEESRNPREAFHGSNPMDRTQEEIRMALDAYHRELAKLNPGASPQMPLGLLALQQQALAQHQQSVSNGGVQDLSIPKDKMKLMNGLEEKDIKQEDMRHSGSAFSLVRPKIEPGTQNTGSTASSPLGNNILPPMTSGDEFTGSAAASPLQRMASITNSLISQPPAQPHHSTSQRPLKAVLPPITQQQFDLYNNLNTEDIVKKVKEQLSQYSISQRLFGESVLGLSQGSVSDLLARPKPWHMLTQKGREPFIRMKMFLEDDNAVHKLVASQYKIAPEKLMRTGGYGGACSTTISKPMPPTTKMLSEAAGLLNKMQETQSLMPSSLQLGPPQNNNPQPPPPPMLLTPPGLPPHHAINLQNPDHLKKSNASPLGVPHSPMGQTQGGLRNMQQHMSPSVYEMAALTQDLDTQVITTKIKEALLANNIGQKIFGECVLGLSQGSVSELLSKPKPWHMLSIKGREPFIRMQLWLNDAHNVDRLQALKNERREASKRRRSSGPGAHDNSSDTSSNDTSEFYHSNSPGPGPQSAKKQRVLFSEEQKEALRLAFTLDPYPNVATIEFLANELGLSSRTITNWFHNHRMRLKQQVPHGMPSDIPPRDQSGSNAPFDPVQFRLLLNQRLMELSKERMGLSGVPLPYPPYLTANTNLAALISRGLLPTGDMDLAALNNAVKEQMSGLDLSMPSLKREPMYDDEEDVESNVGSEDSNMSTGSLHGEVKIEQRETPRSANQGRSSRRKPVAPQWVNPDWQEDKDKTPTGDEVIINGVCVMQTEDYDRGNSEETVHVEPTPVNDRFDDDRSDASSVSEKHDDKKMEEDEVEDSVQKQEDSDKQVKQEEEQERWDY